MTNRQKRRDLKWPGCVMGDVCSGARRNLLFLGSAADCNGDRAKPGLSVNYCRETEHHVNSAHVEILSKLGKNDAHVI